jgi:hypothetical protein
VVHADETRWSIDGDSAHVWFHGNEDLAHYHIDPSRAGEVSGGLKTGQVQSCSVQDLRI